MSIVGLSLHLHSLLDITVPLVNPKFRVALFYSITNLVFEAIGIISQANETVIHSKKS